MKLAWLAALSLLSSACDTSGIREAYMSLDSTGNRKREHFFTDTEAIYCIAKMVSGVDDVTLTARLHVDQIYDPRDGKALNVDYDLGVRDEAPGKGEDITVSFQLERPESDAPYTAGRYVCELALDGEVAERVPFEIALPSCPEAPIFNGGVCAGFVIVGARCEGALSTPCTCGSDGLWSCQ